jgi:hypothetical protein
MSGGFIKRFEVSSWKLCHGNPYAKRAYQRKVTREQLKEQVYALLDDWIDIKSIVNRLRRDKKAIREILIEFSVEGKVDVKRLEQQSVALQREAWHVYYRRKHETKQEAHGNVCPPVRKRSKGSGTQADLGIS